MHGITLITAYIPTHFNVEANYLSLGKLVPEWHLFPCICQAALFVFGVNWRWICWYPHIPINISYITPWESLLPLQAMG